MMERRVKERLIGATLLVVLIVLIVPEMLSGPKPPSAKPLTVGLPTSIATPTRSVSVDLATSKATAEIAAAVGWRCLAGRCLGRAVVDGEWLGGGKRPYLRERAARPRRAGERTHREHVESAGTLRIGA